MKDIDFETLCELFYASQEIPIRYYNEDKILLIQYPLIEDEMDAFSNVIDEFYEMKSTVSFLSSNHSLFFGCIRDKNTSHYILIGPVSSVPCSDNEVRTIMAESFVPSKYYDLLIHHLSLIPCTDLKRFISTLGYLHYQINDFVVPNDEIFPYANTDSQMTTQLNQQIVSASYNNRDDKSRSFTDSYTLEQKYLNMIGSGNVDALMHHISNNTLLIPGVLADTPVRHNKNSFIINIALVSRCAIQNGLDVDTAFQLCEAYINQIERAQSVDAMYNLSYNAFIDYAKRIFKSQIPNGISPMIYKCIQFVGNSVNAPVTVADVAEHIGKSKVYLSTKFKSELGFSLNHYITRRKIEEAKSLLCFTDKPISEISSYLCFSSQSYFQNVFKKVTKLTPQKYREKGHHFS